MPSELSPKSLQPVGRSLGSLLAGATYPLQALGLFLSTPKLRSYVLVPILINLVIGVTVYAGLLYGGLEAIDTLITSLPTWTASIPDWAVHLPDWKLPAWNLPDWLPSLPHWKINFPALPDWNISAPSLPNWVMELPNWIAIALIWLLRVVLTIALLLVTGFIFLQFGGLLGSPWYGQLSEELERMKMGSVVRVEVGLPQDITRAILYELKKLGLTIALSILLLVLTFIPGIGAAVIGSISLAFAATIVCMDFLDAAVERRRPRFREKLGIVWQSLPASGTFGLVCLGLVSTPLINLLAVPVCVAAGTLFFCDRILPGYDKPVEGQPPK